LTSTESHILHILGQPGSGKSVLAAFLYQFRIWSAPDQVVFYFAFHDQKDRQSAFFAWSSLVSQLLIEDPSLFSTLIPNHRIERRRAQYGDGNSWSEPQLRQTFEQLALGCQYPSVYIIDALDQCDTSLERFLGSFSNLIKRTAGPPIKVLVLSKYQSPAALPTQFLRALTIDLDSEIEHQNDIDKFIKEKVDELCEQRGLGVFGDLIRERLSQNASGMYLLPYLAIKTLKSVRSTRREIITALTSLPESLASAYRQTLDAVHPDDRVVTGTILRWVVFGIRPLTVEELSTAAAVKSSVTDISEVSDETSVDVMGDRGVVELVGSILKVTKDRLVSLVHQSARIFLLKTELNSASPPSWLLEIFYGSDHIPAIMQVESLSSHAHEGLAKNCACYIELVRQKLRIINAGGFAEQTYQRESSNTFDEANVDSCDAEKFPLLEYAVEALSEHVREVDSSKSDFHVYFASYLASEAGKLWIEKFWSLRDPGQRHIVQPPLHIACLLGLLPTIRSRLELGDDPNIRDSFGKNTAIAVAASTGSVEMMRILCEAGAHVNAPQTGNWTALHTAVFYGHKEVVKFLLDESAELDAMEDELKRYPMDLAVEAGNHAILQVLLLRGGLLKTSERIFPGSFKSLEWNALHSAARCGRVDTLKWLLANGYGSLTDQDFKQKTPLHIATEAEQIDCVRCLLDEGSCDNIHDSDGNYALHLAAGKGLDDIILLLLDHKVVDINAVDKFGRNAFFHASTTRQIRTMAILLERGIDVDIEDENGDTVLKLLITKWGRPFGADERPIPLIDAETLKYVWEVSNKRPCQKNGDNLLHISTRHFPRSIGLFLDLGLDPYETNIDGQTPLHIATLERNRRGFELFLGLYDNIDQQDSTGQTALHILLKSYGGKDLGQRLDLLIAKGVNIHLQDNYNRTGFDYYCADVCAYNRSRYRRAYWSDRIISRLLSHNAEFSDEFKTRKEDLLINLIKAGLPEDTKQVLHTTGAMDLEELKKRGVEDKIVIFIWLMGHPEDTLLRFIERLDLEWLELLFGVELCEHRSTSGVACAQCSDSITLHTLTTPAVLSAAEKGDLALLEYLVGKCSADPNIPHRPSLRTALSYAAENGHIAAAKYLVSKKAKLEAVDADGRTALWWATKEERTEMVKFLSEAERT
jgi:ankyrin repeat protein